MFSHTRKKWFAVWQKISWYSSSTQLTFLQTAELRSLAKLNDDCLNSLAASSTSIVCFFSRFNPAWVPWMWLRCTTRAYVYVVSQKLCQCAHASRFLLWALLHTPNSRPFIYDILWRVNLAGSVNLRPSTLAQSLKVHCAMCRFVGFVNMFALKWFQIMNELKLTVVELCIWVKKNVIKIWINCELENWDVRW